MRGGCGFLTKLSVSGCDGTVSLPAPADRLKAKWVHCSASDEVSRHPHPVAHVVAFQRSAVCFLLSSLCRVYGLSRCSLSKRAPVYVCMCCWCCLGFFFIYIYLSHVCSENEQLINILPTFNILCSVHMLRQYRITIVFYYILLCDHRNSGILASKTGICDNIIYVLSEPRHLP